MSEFSAEEQTPRRRSRREMREAEREAEREAYLTGQQPLLTRRELRRLREEEEALQAALAAGQITAEQADALRNPLAAQPDIPVRDISATGMHAAIRAEIADDAALRADATSPQEASQSAAGTPKGERPFEVPTSLPKAEAVSTPSSQSAALCEGEPLAPQAADAGDVADSTNLAESATNTPEAGFGVGQDETANAAKGTAADAAEAPSAAPAAAQTETRVAELSEEKKLAISEVPTGEYSLEAIAAEGKEDAVGHEASDEAASGRASADSAESGAGETGETSARPVPTRRPIVRIPRSVQGVRSVDQHTGELTPVRPLDEDFEPIETPAWTALRDGDGEASAPAQRVEEGTSRQEVAEAVNNALKTTEPADTTTVVGLTANIDGVFPARPAGETGRRPIVASDGETINWRDVNNDAEDLALEEKSSPFMRHFLLALLVLVVVLVAATLLWFFLARPSTATAVAAMPLEALQAFLS